jgi:hypothetical protein
MLGSVTQIQTANRPTMEESHLVTPVPEFVLSFFCDTEDETQGLCAY